MNKGQISLMMALIGAGGMIIASAFTSWATISNKVQTVQTRIQVVEERETNHYSEIQKQLTGIDTKLDKLINGK